MEEPHTAEITSDTASRGWIFYLFILIYFYPPSLPCVSYVTDAC